MATRAEVVGEIAIQVTADPKGFAAKLTAALKAAGAKASKSNAFKPIVDDAEKAAKQAGTSFGRTFEREVIRATSRNRRSFFSRLFGSGSSGFRNEIRSITSGFGGLLGAMIGLVPGGEGLIKVFTTLGLKAFGSSIASAVTLIGVFAALALEIAALLGWLVQLVGLLNILPAALAIAVAAVVPLIIAFQGMGDALAALASGNIDKINAAMKKLTPSARAFVKEFYLLKPFWTGLKKSVQEAFFSQTKGGLTRVIDNLGPSLRKGLTAVSGLLGQLAMRMLNALANPKVAAGLDAIFETVEAILAEMAGPAGEFFKAFGKSIIAALPSMVRIFGLIGKFVDKFAGWLIESIESGKFEKWIDNALKTLGELNDLIGAIIGWFKQLFADLGGEGESTIKTITKLFQVWTEDLKDPGAKKAIDGLILLFKGVGASLLGLLITLGYVSGAIGTVVSWLQTAYNWFKKVLGLGSSGQMKGEADQAIQDAGRRNLGNAFQKVPHFAAGGTVDSATTAVVGESGPEAIVPLTNPARAAQVMNDAGLSGLLYGGAGGPSVHVYIGGKEIFDILKVIVDRSMNRSAAAVTAGAREA